MLRIGYDHSMCDHDITAKLNYRSTTSPFKGGKR